MTNPAASAPGRHRSSPAGGPASQTPATGVDRGASAWVGWIAFSGLCMLVLGTFQVLQGLVALVREDYLLVGRTELVLDLDYTAWGWTHVALGVVVALAGIGVFAAWAWARVAGVVVAMLTLVVSMGFLPAYPAWSLLIIGLCVVVIWALTVHGSDITPGG
ncbi:MAG TPA: hypothetical protein VLA97_02835 [Nocardioidaceae bacterium]|nr:hypothetical protein [Nocardioidaceae bacterium]